MTRNSGRSLAYFGMTIGAVGSVAANVAVAFIPPSPIAPDMPASELTRAQIQQLTNQPFTPDVVQIIWGVMIAVALFVAVQVLERIDWPEGRGWLMVRFVGAGLVAGVAAAWSYYHLTTLLLNSLTERSGVAEALCYFGSFIVEGLMALCSAALLVPTRSHTRSADPIQVPDSRSAGPARLSIGGPDPASSSPDAAAPDRVDQVGSDRVMEGSTDRPIQAPDLEDDPTRSEHRSETRSDAGQSTRSGTRSKRRGSGRRSGGQRSRSDSDLWAELEQAIELGFVDRDKPTADAIRIALQCAPAKSRQLRDALAEPAGGKGSDA